MNYIRIIGVLFVLFGLFTLTSNVIITGYSIVETFTPQNYPGIASLWLIIAGYSLITIKRKKGQAAMEFLMTYGWAILALIAALAVLAYFGIFSPSVRVNTPTLPAPFLVTGSNYANDRVQYEVENIAPFGIYMSSVTIKSDSTVICSYDFSPEQYLAQGTRVVVTLDNCQDIPSNAQLSVNYRKSYSQLPESAQGNAGISRSGTSSSGTTGSTGTGEQDTSPPEQSNHNPPESTDLRSAGAEDITFTLDEDGDCKIDLQDIGYSEHGLMDCDGDGTQSITCNLGPLPNGEFILYFSCKDTLDNVDTDETNTDLSYSYG